MPDWSGSTILRQTVIPSKRQVVGSPDTLIPTDLREWISHPDSNKIRTTLENLDLPSDKTLGTLDERARKVWRFVIHHVKYTQDTVAQKRPDFWQFPAETLALGSGDCEDCSFLLTTLLMASGISPYCVRVVLGRVVGLDGQSGGHAWPIYKDEEGVWRVLEATLDAFPEEWPAADDACGLDADPRYLPDLCLNRDHVWVITQRKIKTVSSYLDGPSRKRRPALPWVKGVQKI